MGGHCETTRETVPKCTTPWEWTAAHVAAVCCLDPTALTYDPGVCVCVCVCVCVGEDLVDLIVQLFGRKRTETIV